MNNVSACKYLTFSGENSLIQYILIYLKNYFTQLNNYHSQILSFQRFNWLSLQVAMMDGVCKGFAQSISITFQVFKLLLNIDLILKFTMYRIIITGIYTAWQYSKPSAKWKWQATIVRDFKTNDKILNSSLKTVLRKADIKRWLEQFFRMCAPFSWCHQSIILIFDNPIRTFIRSLSGLRSNFCGLESHKNIGNSILSFEPTGYGHDILTKILVQVNTRFNGQVWAANGPDLITNTMLQECEATVSSLMAFSLHPLIEL